MSRASKLISDYYESELSEGFFSKQFSITRPTPALPRDFDWDDPFAWDNLASLGDYRAVNILGDDTYRELTRHQLKELEKEEQRDLYAAFKEANPHVLARLKKSMIAREWKKLIWMLSKGAFFGAATYAFPIFFVPAGAIIGYKIMKDRKAVKKSWGIKRPHFRFKYDPEEMR